MKEAANEKRYRRILKLISHFAIFFLLIGFVITCCIVLFLHAAQNAGVVYTEENIQFAAKITFANVLILSLLCTAIDAVRRYVTIGRPVKQIVEATEKVVQGDFSVRIDKFKLTASETGIPVVVDHLNRMIEELSSMETLRTDFIANVSHELKSPLAVMQNYGTLLQQTDLPEEKRMEYAKAITDACRGLASMVTNILKLNKLENQTIYPEAKAYDLGEQLCECLIGFEDAWEKKGLEIDTDIEENIFVKSDPELLSLVWNNLFSNAIKFTDPGGSVSLRLKSEGAYAVIGVSDTGCGISQEAGKHIFEKFYQGDTSHATKGNGLGLALVKRVIDIAGGDIWVSSEIGKGSTFTVKLRRETGGKT